MIAELPDLPRWVEAHDLAADPTSWRQPLGGGFAIGNDANPLIVIAGDPSPEAVASLARAHPGHTVLVPAERAAIAAALDAAERTVARAILHTLPEPDALPHLDGAAPLPAEASLAHLPHELAAELVAARARTPVWAVWVDDLPVSFAYVASRSPAWFGISVDTAPGARQLGLATIVATTLIHDERARGRAPVWGAVEHNLASLRLARRLGFQPVDKLWIAPAVAPA